MRRREVDDRSQVCRPPPALPVEAEKLPEGVLSRFCRQRGERSHGRRHLLHPDAEGRPDPEAELQARNPVGPSGVTTPGLASFRL